MIDFSFIARLEGSSRKGYVPDPKTSQSGVTIAGGFDIGQRSNAEIAQAFNPSLANKLSPYCGKKRIVALTFLQCHPLEISAEEELIINQYSHAQAEQRLRQQWQNSQAKVDFDDLSAECQTVVASVAFQYGNLATRTPYFWQQVTAGDWQGAVINLRYFGDRYPTRRNLEADYLEGAMA